MRPVIALLTDFGTRDHYAGTMKGVMLGICPDITLVDITHDIPPHDVLEGALQLAAAFRYFPAGTIFLAVVDPGVGSARRGLAAETGDYRFVAPDNGVLTAVFREIPPKQIVELTERRYARPTVSRTFEGRDRFAPAAAWLAKGIQLSALGRAVTELPAARPPAAHGGRGVPGRRRRPRRSLRQPRHQHRSPDLRGLRRKPPRDADGRRPRGRALVATYADIRPGEICALFGSTDHLELAATGGSAATALAVTRGAVVAVRRAHSSRSAGHQACVTCREQRLKACDYVSRPQALECTHA